MATYKLTLEYCGTDFQGWAMQPGKRTVEAVLAGAVETVLTEQVKLTVAGRTDAGVHAWGQVASFDSQRDADPPLLERSLNGLLAHDIAVVGAERAPDGFDARRDARSRSYCYRVLRRSDPSPFERGRALWWPHDFDEKSLGECAAALAGTHDFTAFTPTQTGHTHFEREIVSARWDREGDIAAFRIEADTFMRHMVRVVVGTMLEVARGRGDVDEFVRLLEGAPRSAAGPTAEPHGLYLASVSY
ncbi:MAG: tRNA pseudouridine(38-40) synthase TruA [Solirubrobacterales bacterium]